MTYWHRYRFLLHQPQETQATRRTGIMLVHREDTAHNHGTDRKKRLFLVPRCAWRDCFGRFTSSWCRFGSYNFKVKAKIFVVIFLLLLIVVIIIVAIIVGNAVTTGINRWFSSIGWIFHHKICTWCNLSSAWWGSMYFWCMKRLDKAIGVGDRHNTKETKDANSMEILHFCTLRSIIQTETGTGTPDNW